MRVRTGVEGFDTLVAGGLPQGASIVLRGPSGNEKDTFALQFLAARGRPDRRLLLLPTQIAQRALEHHVETLATGVHHASLGQDR